MTITKEFVESLDNENKVTILKKVVLKLTRAKLELEDRCKAVEDECASLHVRCNAAEASLRALRIECEELRGKQAERGDAKKEHLQSSGGNLVGGLRSLIASKSSTGASKKSNRDSEQADTLTSGASTTTEILHEENERLHEQLFEVKSKSEQVLGDLQRRVETLKKERDAEKLRLSQDAMQQKEMVDRCTAEMTQLRSCLQREEASHQHACKVLNRKLILHDCAVGDLRFLAVHRPHPILLCSAFNGPLCTLKSHLVQFASSLETLLLHAIDYSRYQADAWSASRSGTQDSDAARRVPSGEAASASSAWVPLENALDVLNVHTARVTAVFETPPAQVESTETSHTFVRWLQCIEDSIALVTGWYVTPSHEEDVGILSVLRKWQAWFRTHPCVFSEGLLPQQRTCLQELLLATQDAADALCTVIISAPARSHANNVGGNPTTHRNDACTTMEWVVRERLHQDAKRIAQCVEQIVKPTLEWIGAQSLVDTSDSNALAALQAWDRGCVVGDFPCSASSRDGQRVGHSPPVPRFYHDVFSVHSALRKSMMQVSQRWKEEDTADCLRAAAAATTAHGTGHGDALENDKDTLRNAEMAHVRHALHYADGKAVEYYLQWQTTLSELISVTARVATLEADVLRRREDAEVKERTSQHILENYAQQIQVLTERIVELEEKAAKENSES